MKRNWFNAPVSDAAHGLDIVRVSVAIILAVHGLQGFVPGDADGFGGYLSSEGFPFGVVLAWLVIAIQVLASAALVLRRLVVPACTGHIIVLGTGIALIHAKAGWFVVGHGHNGMEYSLLLIACLFAVLWAHWPRQQIVK